MLLNIYEQLCITVCNQKSCKIVNFILNQTTSKLDIGLSDEERYSLSRRRQEGASFFLHHLWADARMEKEKDLGGCNE